MNIDILDQTDSPLVSTDLIRSVVEKTTIFLKQRNDIPEAIDEVSILITTDAEIQKLNKQYRNKNKPTDVLSFAQLEGEEAKGTALGDVVISLQTAEKQAEESGVSINEELARLLVHGLLHLAGYDHENVSEEEAERMFDLQDQIIEELKLAQKDCFR